jgi:hypothetical protein
MRLKHPPLTANLPPPQEIGRRIEACRDEIAALKKLLRLSVAARQADEARERRGEAADAR